tara:strand:- start:1585 stop:2718 length:1134 start_codon:yes stop_codon:yes gene_type:complete
MPITPPSSIPEPREGTDLTTTDYSPFPQPASLSAMSASSMMVAAAANIASPVTGTWYPGPWFITEQSLEIEYIRKERQSLNRNVGAAVSCSSLDSSGELAHSLFVRFTPTVKKYISHETFITSSHEQLQEFTHAALNSDLNGLDYGPLATNRLGVRGQISTIAPYLKREAYDSTDPLHTVTDYNYPDFYNYAVQTSMVDIFDTDAYLEGGILNHGAWMESWQNTLGTVKWMYNAMFTDGSLDYRISYAGGMQNDDAAWKYVTTPLLNNETSDSWLIWHNDWNNLTLGNYDGSGQGQSPQDIINDLCDRMDLTNFKRYFFSPELFHIETLVASTPNSWGNYYNDLSFMKSSTGDIPYDTSINLWLDSLKTEYTRIRHL